MSTPENQLTRPLSIPEFAAKIRAKHPAYTSLTDNELTRRVLEKYPSYRDHVDLGDVVTNEAAASTAQANSEAAQRPYLDAQGRSPLGRQLNPDVVQTAARPKLGPHEEGIVSLASDSEPLQKPLQPLQVQPTAPVALDPVIQSRLEATKQQARQREIQQRVQKAQQVMARRRGPFAGLQSGVEGDVAGVNRAALGVAPPISETLSAHGLEQAQQRESIRPQIEAQVRAERQARAQKEAAVPAGIISNERIWNPERLNSEADIQHEVDLRTREAIPEIQWQEANRVEIDRLTQQYRQVIRASGAIPESGQAKWTAETIAKGGAGLSDLMAGALKQGGRLTSLVTGNRQSTEDAANTMRVHAQALQQAAMAEGADRSQASQFVSDIAGGLIGSAPEMGLMALGVPAPLAFALGGGTRATGGGKPAIPAALKGLATGAAFEIGGVGQGATRILTRAGGVGLGTAGVELATGATPREAAKTGATNALISLGFNAKEIPKAVLDYTVQSPLTPEPVRDALARLGKYDSWLYRSSDGRNMSIYRDPQTGAFGGVEIDAKQADKYDQAVNPGKVSKKTRQTSDVEPDVYEDLAKALGVETQAPKKGLPSETEVLPRSDVSEARPTAAGRAPKARAVDTKVRVPEGPLPEPSTPTERVSSELAKPIEAETEVIPEVSIKAKEDIPSEKQATAPVVKPQAATGTAEAAPIREKAPAVTVEPSKEIEGPAYQVPTGFTPRGTAADIVRHETETLGNDLGVTTELLKELEDVPADRLSWVTKSAKDAERYGAPSEVEQHDLPKGSRIVAEDGDGGYLVLRPADAETSPVARISPSNEEPKQATVDKTPQKEPIALRSTDVKQKMTDWGSRLKTIAESKNLDDLKALSDEMAAHKDDPKVARLRTVIQAELARARQPVIPERAAEPARAQTEEPPKLSKAGAKMIAEAERPEGKTIGALAERGYFPVLFYGEQARKHELFHEASDKANRYMQDRHADLPGLINNDAFRTMSDALIAQGYSGTNLPVLVEEAAAHIAEGRYEALGITREQAIDWMEKWFKSFEAKNPHVNPRQFQEMGDEAEEARNKVYAAESGISEQKPDQDVSSLQEGRKEGDRAGTAASFAREPDDPWSRLSDLADDFERIADEPDLPEGEKLRSLPKTLDMAGLESGPTKGYTPESLAEGVEYGKRIVAEKGLDGAMEFVRTGDGIEWASTGFEVSAQLRADEARLRAEGKTEEADKIQEKRLKFLDDFALATVERGRSVVGIKAVAEFSPDRMAYMLNKVSLKKRKRSISPEEDARIAALGEQLGALEDRNKSLEKALGEAKAQAKRRAPAKGKAAKTDYQSKLNDQAQTILQTLKPKVGKFDFAGLGRSSEKGALTVGIPPLPGDAELLAQYAAGQLSKFYTVADLNTHLLTEFGQDIAPYLPKIRQRAYGIRQEARLAEIEAQDTDPKRRKTILGEIQKEIAASLNAIRDAQKAQEQAEKAERRAQATEMRAEARTAAKEARQAEVEAKKQISKEARADLKRLREEMKQASKAETAGYRETIKAQREAARKAELWDTPLRNEAAAARERLKTATDANNPETMADLVSVAAEHFLPEEAGGVPRKGAVEPARVYKDLKEEFPKLVNKKNQGEIYKRGYQRIQDMTAAAREAARLRSATAESKRMWDELGDDVDAQAVLIKQAEVRRQTDELRRKAVAEFNRVSRTMLERVWMEAQAIPRSMMSSIDAPLGRQGVYFLLTHPIQASKSAIPATLQGYGSIHVQDFVRAELDLEAHPDFGLAKKSGLDLSEPSGTGDPALQAEEQFQSPLASKIFPHVRLSEQGYVLGMNAERLAMFSRLADVGRADGYTPEANMDFFEEVAKFVNDGTGRGNLPDAIKRASALTNFFFFSTRLNISRIQLLNDLFNPVKFMRHDPAMRKVMVGELLRLAAALGTIYLLAKAMGIRTEFDPEDPDAFLLRVRNTRYDITGGEAGTVRFLYRLLKGIYRSATGEDMQEYEQPLAIAGKFLRYKLAPLPAGVIDGLSGKDAVGNPANLLKFKSTKQVMQENIVVKRLLPILTGNFIDAVSEEGWIGIPMALPSIAGFNVSSYPDRGIRAIKNQAAVDELERLKITSQTLIGQKTKDDQLDQAIHDRILERVEHLEIPQGATDVGKEKLIRERLETIRTLAKAETALAEPARYADYLKNRNGNESLSFLTDEEKKHLTEDDLKQYRAKYADAYIETLKKATSTNIYKTLDDDQKEKLLARVGRVASTLAKRQIIEQKRPATK